MTQSVISRPTISALRRLQIAEREFRNIAPQTYSGLILPNFAALLARGGLYTELVGRQLAFGRAAK